MAELSLPVIKNGPTAPANPSKSQNPYRSHLRYCNHAAKPMQNRPVDSLAKD